MIDRLIEFALRYQQAAQTVLRFDRIGIQFKIAAIVLGGFVHLPQISGVDGGL